MSTHRPIRALLVGATTLGALLAGPVAPVAADHEPVCVTAFGDKDHNEGKASYQATPVYAGKNKKTTIVGWSDGGFHADATFLQSALCPGASLSFVVQSVAGGPALGWTTTKAEALPEEGTTTPNLLGTPGTTVVSEDGRTATVTFSGDAVSRRFFVDGSTADTYGQQCVTTYAEVTSPLGTTSRSRTLETCAIPVSAGGGGGTSYFG